jgi:uncharacterized protein (DUF1697 family)
MATKLVTYVALLRGVNVGGNAMINMKALKESFEKAGYENVRTYINSGNVIFETNKTDPRKLEVSIEKILSKEYKLESKVVIRSFEEMEKLVKVLPKDWDGSKERRFNVMFLRHTIDSKDILKDLKPKEGIEDVVYKSGALLWSAYVKTLTRSSMLKVASAAIYKDMTIRNLNTTKKLYELMKVGQ